MGCQRVLPDVLPAGDEIQESFHVHLEPVPRDVGRARSFMREHAPATLPDSTAEVLLLLTSELVTNAVLHARTSIELGLTVAAHSVLVTVHDEDLARHEHLPYDGREGGWGLGLVRALASASALQVHPGDGKTAWFLLPRHDEVAAESDTAVRLDSEAEDRPGMNEPSGIAGVFDRAADTYDAVGVPWFGPIAAGLVEELDVRPGERVLDIGCGRGAALVPLARAAGPSGSALGIDLAPRMVERTAAEVADLPWVEVWVADASAPDLPASSYDVLSSCLVLFFLPEPGEALQRWAELLARGGRMGVTTFGPQDERWKAVDAVFAPYLPQQMRDARTTGSRGPFASDEGMEALLREAGLVDVRTAQREVIAEFADPQQWLDFSWSHGQRAMWEAVPAEQRDAVRDQVVALLEGLGPLGFRQTIRHTLGRRP